MGGKHVPVCVCVYVRTHTCAFKCTCGCRCVSTFVYMWQAGVSFKGFPWVPSSVSFETGVSLPWNSVGYPGWPAGPRDLAVSPPSSPAPVL